jgi:methylated-DNA-protein-cysteine methyltransferase-like protein
MSTRSGLVCKSRHSTQFRRGYLGGIDHDRPHSTRVASSVAPRRPAVTDPTPDPHFANNVRRVIESVGAGEVVTYGEVAREAGYAGAARAVGTLLARDGSDLPWWRVVTTTGRLVPGNEVEHAARLRAEGVEIGGVPARVKLRGPSAHEAVWSAHRRP